MKKTARIFIWLAAAVLAVSCVDDFTPDVKDAPEPRLVIDGLLTTEPAAHRVRLSMSAPFGTPSSQIPVVSGASVSIWDGEKTVTLTEDPGTGCYYTPEDYYGQEGRTYRLDVEVDLEGERRHYSAEDEMPPKGIRGDAMDYYKMADSVWMFTIWGQDLPGIASHYAGELVVHDRRLPVGQWVFIDGLSMFDGNYLFAGEYLPYMVSELIPSEEPLTPLVEGDMVTLRFYSLSDFFYDWILAMTNETTARIPMLSSQPANLPSNVKGDTEAMGSFMVADLTTLTVEVKNPERTREEMLRDHLPPGYLIPGGGY
ncbi:MAG: DUF4249 domain-containing protein [Bacteroidales bacterium]|nr:DUF4249 domain-containing protein [Bacteroidales bacterium]